MCSQEIIKRGKRLGHVRIQMDNAGKENKNRNVCAFCQWLVAMGFCDFIELCFLPVGHTHERVDQLFSRVSLALSRAAAFCLEVFLDIVRWAFTPKPNVQELSVTLDFSKFFSSSFQKVIEDMSTAHRFEFTRSSDAATGAVLRTALWSDTPLKEPCEIIAKLPSGTPEIRAGRPLLYARTDTGKIPDAARLQKYLDDFDGTRAYLEKLAEEWDFDIGTRQSWASLLDDIDEKQRQPAYPFDGFWPSSPSEAAEFIKDLAVDNPRDEAPTIHPAIPSDAEIDRQVRQKVSSEEEAFRGVYAGDRVRLHDNTSPEDAKETNLVVVDISDVDRDENETAPPTLGKWESHFLVGVVKGSRKKPIPADKVLVIAYEPYVVGKDGAPLMPLWLHARMNSTQAIDTSWEAVVKLPWKRIGAVPLDYAQALHVAEHKKAGKFRNAVKSYFNQTCDVVPIDKKKGYLQTQPRERCVYVVSTSAEERHHNGTISFSPDTIHELCELQAFMDD